MVWEGCSSVKVKMRVSDEMDFFEERTAFVQVLFWRKVGRGSVDSEETSELSCSTRREASSREPIW